MKYAFKTQVRLASHQNVRFAAYRLPKWPLILCTYLSFHSHIHQYKTKTVYFSESCSIHNLRVNYKLKHWAGFQKHPCHLKCVTALTLNTTEGCACVLVLVCLCTYWRRGGFSANEWRVLASRGLKVSVLAPASQTRHQLLGLPPHGRNFHSAWQLRDALNLTNLTLNCRVGVCARPLKDTAKNHIDYVRVAVSSLSWRNALHKPNCLLYACHTHAMIYCF